MDIKEMGHLICENIVADASLLNEVWSAEWNLVGENSTNNQRIIKNVDALRSRVRYEFRALNDRQVSRLLRDKPVHIFG